MTFDYSPQLKVLWVDGWIMYLRKSRQDDPNETVEEVLAKHETMLQEYAERELGGRIPEENIYREVVSGESIDDRVEIKKVLARIENQDVLGVLVVEPSRLSRGDLSDCARVIDAFRFTHTLVATPMMTYDLEKKMERKFFQDELLRGNDYLEYTKEILFRGRVAAVKRGCYISAIAPYGYNRVKIGKDWTLEPNENADAVRMSFSWYVNDGMSPGMIARKLNGMGYLPTQAGEWTRECVNSMLLNIHYTGKVKYNEFRTTWVMENGERVKKLLRQPADEVIIAEGKHPALIDMATFEAVRARMAKNPKIKSEHELVNPLAGILRCARCGRSMIFDRNTKRPNVAARYKCRHRPSCLKSAKADEVLAAVLYALEHVELPKLHTKLKNGDGEAATIQKRLIAKLAKQMEEYRQQEEKQFELLETGKYSQALFDRRNAVLREKMEACENQLQSARASMPQNVDYAERIVTLQEAIKALRDPDMSNEEKNQLAHTIIDRIEMDTTAGEFNRTQIHLQVFLRL